MRTVQDLSFGVEGQTLYFDAPEGRPTAVSSVKVFHWNSSDNGTEQAAVGSPSIEANPDTLIESPSGYGLADPRELLVADVTGFDAGRRYLVIGDSGAREWFDVLEVDDSGTLTAKHPLHNAYDTPATVQSTRVQATIDPAWVADETNLDSSAGPNPSYRVRWVYTVSGVTYVADSYFNLVRYVGAHGVRPQDVETTHPGWLDRLPTDHYRDQGRRLIDEAYRAVKLDLHAIWTDDAMVAHPEVIDDLTRWKALELGELARFMSSGQNDNSYAAAKAAYQSRFDQLARITNKLPIRDHTGSAGTVVTLGITRR